MPQLAPPSRKLEDLDKALLQKEASRNKLAKKKETPSEKGESLMDLFGVWSKEEADQFAKSIDELFEKVDPDEWK